MAKELKYFPKFIYTLTRKIKETTMKKVVYVYFINISLKKILHEQFKKI